MPDLNSQQTEKALLALTDQCVKCGLCLSTCPTYRLKINEADSPRGRVSLIQGLLHKQINPSDKKLQQHIDGCLSCGNCESACPSAVRFIDLLDQAKSCYPLSSIPRWQLSLLSSSRLLTLAINAARYIPRSFSSLLPGLAGQLLKNKPARIMPVKQPHKPVTPVKNRIGVFTGCVGRVVDSDAINLTCQLLAKLGHEVIIPATQNCCGAMHQHEGYLQDADNLSDNNIRVFKQEKLDAIIYFASGCAAQLLKSRQQFSAPLMEASAYLATLKLPAVDKPAHKIAIHSPCTLKNQTDAWPVMIELVKKFAGNQLVELPENQICCGSAGLHLLKHPHTANQLMQPKLEALEQLKPDILLTANTGCALHFRNTIRDAGLNIRIMHPAEWVSEQLLKSI